MIRTASGDREGFLQALHHLHSRLRSFTIWLYVDRARWHKGEPVERFLSTRRRLHLRYLSPYQPGLNPQERIWRQIHHEATTNRWFATPDDIWSVVQKTTRSWSTRKVRSLRNIA